MICCCINEKLFYYFVLAKINKNLFQRLFFCVQLLFYLQNFEQVVYIETFW